MEESHDRDGFHQLRDLARHQPRGSSDPSLPARLSLISGWGSYFGKVVIGWIGGWLGSPVLGHWWSQVRYEELYVVPAFLGCAGLVILAVDLAQTFGGQKPS